MEAPLMTYRASQNAVDLIKEFEGAPRLKARRCSGDRWEVGYGCTYWFDGRAVKKGDKVRPQDVDALLAHCLAIEAAPVLDALTFEPTQNQADALAAFAYNIGGNAACDSSVVAFANDGRMEDAAAAFGLWTGATSNGPTESARASGRYDDIIAYSDTRKRWVWVGEHSRACAYFMRLRGLLRRHHAEACVFLGYDWREACHNDAIALRTRRVWDAQKLRWKDSVVSQTQFKDVLNTARYYPLEDDAPFGEILSPVGKAPVGETAIDYDVDEKLPPKRMEESDRANGFVLQSVGRGVLRLGSRGVLGSTVVGMAQFVENDPELAGVLIALFVSITVLGIGWITASIGNWRRRRGEGRAVQALG